jgi:hypothetical protein
MVGVRDLLCYGPTGAAADLLCGWRRTYSVGTCAISRSAWAETDLSVDEGDGAPTWRPRAATYDNIDERLY